MMKLDPSEEDSDDSGNGGRDSPVGEAGQITDLEVCHSTAFVMVPMLSFVLFICVCFPCQEALLTKNLCTSLLDSVAF